MIQPILTSVPAQLGKLPIDKADKLLPVLFKKVPKKLPIFDSASINRVEGLTSLGFG